MNAQEKLHETIHEAIGLLVPAFKVTQPERTGLREPTIEIWGGRTQYYIGDNKIQFNEKDIEDPLVIGEETSHYLHLGIFPLPFPLEAKGDLFGLLPTAFARELVGRYGALTYVSARGMPIAPWKRGVDMENGSLAFFDSLSHDLGYERAYQLFERHGNKHLPKVARMNPSDLVEFSRRAAPVSWYERKVLPVLDRLRPK